MTRSVQHFECIVRSELNSLCMDNNHKILDTYNNYVGWLSLSWRLREKMKVHLCMSAYPYLIIFKFMNWEHGSLGRSRSKVHCTIGPLAEPMVIGHKLSMEVSSQDSFQGKILSFYHLERERERERECWWAHQGTKYTISMDNRYSGIPQ